jgi:5-dehydro-2-deoxygluconokinase
MISHAAWQQTCEAIERNDAHTRGIVVLGLGSTEEALAESFAIAARYPLVKGFAVGRTIFAEAAEKYLGGTIGAETATAMMAQSYARLCDAWDQARHQQQELSA